MQIKLVHVFSYKLVHSFLSNINIKLTISYIIYSFNLLNRSSMRPLERYQILTKPCMSAGSHIKILVFTRNLPEIWGFNIARSDQYCKYYW